MTTRAQKSSKMADAFIFDSDDLITFCSNFDSIPMEDMTDSLLEVNFQDLNDRWANLQRSYRVVCMDQEAKVAKDFFESVRAKHSACTRAFHKCKAKMLDIQKSFVIDSPNNNFQPVVNEDSYAHVKVPPCDTDIFYGGYDEWPSSRDMFTAVYINNHKIPSVQKLYHLILHLHIHKI